jgi:nifR3 family TIM-barrel protein
MHESTRGFWDALKKPIFVLAPMANVTDAAFRRIIAKYGKFTRPDGTSGGGPDVFWTEFVSVEGLLSRGREKLLVDFIYTEAERPIVAQIFGGKPDQFYEAAKLIVSLGFDGIDINAGCPDKGVEKSGGGACLIKSPELAQKIIAETKRGVADAGSSIPVSIKTRIGYNTNELETWIPKLLEAEPAVITLHARTRKEMSFFPARWEHVARAVKIRDGLKSSTLIFGNGDVQNLEQARARVAETGCDGVMIGRGIFGNPWLFSEHVPTTAEKLRICIEHTKVFEELFGVGTASRLSSPPSVIPKPRDLAARIKPFEVMKKHFKAYVNGFDGAKELRMKMMEAENVTEIEKLVEDFLKSA